VRGGARAKILYRRRYVMPLRRIASRAVCCCLVACACALVTELEETIHRKPAPRFVRVTLAAPPAVYHGAHGEATGYVRLALWGPTVLQSANGAPFDLA
jgi:hypothetical protein